MKKTFLMSLLALLLTGCGGCSQSGSNRRNSHSTRENIANNRTVHNSHNNPDNKTGVIKMANKNGVYEVPIEINGSNMNFIFDTGASDITISDIEAIFLLKQGTLSKEDILGTEYYQIADGSISEGTIINLKTVKIGNKILQNVKASVIHNTQAPLLLGQSALAQFGKVSIDYKKNEISFNE